VDGELIDWLDGEKEIDHFLVEQERSLPGKGVVVYVSGTDGYEVEVEQSPWLAAEDNSGEVLSEVSEVRKRGIVQRAYGVRVLSADGGEHHISRKKPEGVDGDVAVDTLALVVEGV